MLAHLPRAPRLARDLRVLYWIAPVVVWVIVARPIPLPFLTAQNLIAGGIALAVLSATSRTPHRALAIVFGFFPFLTLSFAALYDVGVPGDLLRMSGYWKELMIGAVGVAAFRRFRDDERRLDLLDRLCIAYLCVLAVYLLLPGLVVLGGPGLEVNFSTRLNGFRIDGLFILLFLVARHVRLTRDQLQLLLRVVVSTAAVIGVIGIFEFLFTARWVDFVLQDVNLVAFMIDVLDGLPSRVAQKVFVLNQKVSKATPRIGSTLLDPLALGATLVVAFAVGLESMVQGRIRSVGVFMFGAAAVALLLTQTRGAILAAVIVLALSVRHFPGRAEQYRVRAQSALVLVLVALLPLAVVAGLTGRFGGDETSDERHEEAFLTGLDTLVENPLGTGMATASGAGQVEEVAGRVNSESQYLQVGTQYGVATMLLYIGIFVLITLRLRRVADRAPTETERIAVLGSLGAFIGLSLVGVVSQPYVSLVTPWLLFGLAGAALGAAEAASVDDDVQVTT